MRVKSVVSPHAGWMEAGDQTCTECEEEGVAWVRVVALLIALLVAVLVVVAAYHCYWVIAARGAKKEAGELRWVKPNFVSGGAVRRVRRHKLTHEGADPDAGPRRCHLVSTARS